MAEIDELSLLLLKLIRPMAGLRFSYCFLKMIGGEETQVYKSRALKVLKYYIIAECIFSFKDTIMHYFI